MEARKDWPAGPGSPSVAASLALALVAALAVTAASCSRGDAANGQGGSQDSEAEPETPPIHVRAAPARIEPIAALYSTSTTLRPARRAVVTARTRGVVKRVAAEEGDLVAAGQPLAALEDDEQRIAAARAGATRDTRSAEAERAEALHARGLLSDEAEGAARREAMEARHAAGLAELALARTVIRAPFAGRVLARRADVGASVSDGTPVFEIADTSRMEADVSVPERHVARLAVGQEVRVVLDAEGTPAPARVERIAPEVDTSTGTVKVTLALEDAQGLRPGAFARVEVVTEVRPSALVVQRSALVAEGRKWRLFRVADSGETVEQVTATLGFEEGDRVEIAEAAGKSGPLAVGHLVVVSGASALSDGAKVNVVKDGAEGGAGGGS